MTAAIRSDSPQTIWRGNSHNNNMSQHSKLKIIFSRFSSIVRVRSWMKASHLHNTHLHTIHPEINVSSKEEYEKFLAIPRRVHIERIRTKSCEHSRIQTHFQVKISPLQLKSLLPELLMWNKFHFSFLFFFLFSIHILYELEEDGRKTATKRKRGEKVSCQLPINIVYRTLIECQLSNQRKK